jgi:hypothetical protein
MPEQEQSVVDSISKKVFREIQKAAELSTMAVKKKNAVYYLTVTSIAASIAVLLVWAGWQEVENFYPKSMKQIAIEMASMQLEETDDVLLLVSNTKKLQLTTGAQISYSSEGDISIISEKSMFLNEQKPGKSNEDSYNQLLVPAGKRSQVQLSDGTRIWVNAATKVIYPRIFNDKKREIYVDGEVYLEVTPDKDRPFYVNTERFDVKVLGTSFDVFAYKHTSTNHVVLAEGAVEIEDIQNNQIRMFPDELVIIGKNGIKGKKAAHANDYKNWIDREMALNGDYLNQIVKRLSFWYGKEIVCDSLLNDGQLYGKLYLTENIYDMIDYIKLMIPLCAYEKEGIIYLKREK